MASPESLRGAHVHLMSEDFDPEMTPLPPTVTSVRRTPSGRYLAYSRDEIDVSGDVGSGESPDKQSIDSTISAKVEEQYVSNCIFMGGFNEEIRAQFKDKVIETVIGAHGLSCQLPGCDGNVMSDDRGVVVLPCGCDLRICSDCYLDAIKNGDGKCPGCKEQYTAEVDEMTIIKSKRPPSAMSNMEAKLTKLGTQLSQTRERDHVRWSPETERRYPNGNACRPNGGGGGNQDNRRDEPPPDLRNRPWRPLTRKLKVPAAILSPYRLLIFIRLIALVLFLTWRVKHPNPDAIWLWGMSVVCEIWFGFSWLLDQLPKLCPVNRVTDLAVLKEKFETAGPDNPTGRADLPGVDVFVSTADPEKEPPLVTANTILSILAADYPVEKLACYVTDDGGALLTFEAMTEAARFASLWVPFCRKHNIEPRNPESYFNLKGDPYRNKVRRDFVRDRRRVKREYDEFKVRINGLPDSIRRRSDDYNAREEKNMRAASTDDDYAVRIPKATWMGDGKHWPGTWMVPTTEHSRGDHAGIIQVMLKPPPNEPLMGVTSEDDRPTDFSGVDVRLPLLVYVSREKRPGYDHNKKAGAMNALVRASAIMSNGPFILNLDCDHYVYNSQAVREGMCFMMDRGGDRICYVQFPQRFEGIDPSDRYANHNTVFFDGNMRALDGLQGPVYVGTGCMFRRMALYGFDPPPTMEWSSFFRSCCCCCFGRRKKPAAATEENHEAVEETRALRMSISDDEELSACLNPKKFGDSAFFLGSIPVAEFEGRLIADHPSVKYGRPPGALTRPRERLDADSVAEALSVISCWFEEKTEWGRRIGWIYGSVTEDVVTGYRMHNRGWKSVYCVTKRDAFRGTAPINLTDRLHQVLRWATGSVEIFFSRNNGFLASTRMKFLQRLAYLNVGIYPFTSIFLIVYCFLPALCLFSGQFIVQSLNVTFLAYLLVITLTLCLLAVLEIKWSGITLEEWWRNEQFWLIGGTSAHLVAVLQGLLKVIAGIEISFTLTSKSAGDDADDEFADLYIVKWTLLMVPPLTIIMTNLIAICVGISRTIYSAIPQWSKLLGGVFFSFWVLVHLYPFAKGLMGRRRRTPTVVFIWSGLIAITVSLLWVAIKPPASATGQLPRGSFQFP